MALELFRNVPKSIFTSFIFLARNAPFSESDLKTGHLWYFQHGESGHFLKKAYDKCSNRKMN